MDTREAWVKRRKPIAPGLDPAVTRLFGILDETGRLQSTAAKEAGCAKQMLTWWRSGRHTPNVANLRAVLNTLGYDLAIVPLEKRDDGH